MIEKHSGNYTGLAGDDKNKIEGTFKILSAKCLGYEPVDAKSLEQAEFSKVAAKIKSGEM